MLPLIVYLFDENKNNISKSHIPGTDTPRNSYKM